MKFGTVTMENNMEFPQKVKNRTTSNLTSGYTSKENENRISKDTHMPMFIELLFTIAKIRKQPKCPSVDEWIKEDVFCRYTMEYYSANRKKEISPFVITWMDLEGIMLSEISEKEKEKYCMISLVCRI